MARHAPGSRPLQGFDNLTTVDVVQPDVKKEVNVLPGSIDVTNHPVDRSVGVVEEAAHVATHRTGPADRLTKAKQILVSFQNRG